MTNHCWPCGGCYTQPCVHCMYVNTSDRSWPRSQVRRNVANCSRKIKFVHNRSRLTYVGGLLTLPAWYAEQGLCNGRASVCLSVPWIDSSGGFAAERRRLKQILTDSGRRRRQAANAVSVMLRADGGGSPQACSSYRIVTVHSLLLTSNILFILSLFYCYDLFRTLTCEVIS